MAGFSDPQITMTLAGLCYAGQTKLPLETVEHQEQRILGILNSPQALGNAGLATAGAWEAVWVGLSDDRANMSYIARNEAANSLAVAIRGTDFEMVIDRDEDFRVSTVVPFTAAGPSAGHIAQGAMEAFTEITSSKFAVTRTTVVQELSRLVGESPGCRIYVTGHSLGGAIATTLGLYLQREAQVLSWDATLQVYTFAAPTAGLADFAGAFDAAFAGSAWRVFNVIDAVPCAWSALDDIKKFYPGGPAATWEVKALVDLVKLHAAGKDYTQPSGNPVPLNQGAHPLKDPQYLHDDTLDFLHQIAFEHHGNTYLTLLDAPLIPALPSDSRSVS